MKYQVKIHKVINTEKTVKAVATAIIEDKIAIHGIRVVENEKGRFLVMPHNVVKNKEDKEIRRDIVHPITSEARQELKDAVFAAYETALKETNNEQ